MIRKLIYIAEREELIICGLNELFKALPDPAFIYGYGKTTEEVLQDFAVHAPDILFIDEKLMLRQSLPLYVFLSEKYPNTSTILMRSTPLLQEKQKRHADYCISKALLDEAGILKLWSQLSKEPHKQKNAANSIDIDRIKDYILEHLKDDVTLESIANEFGHNYSYLSTYFTRHTKKSFNQYINELRIQHACALLSSGQISISKVGSESGYSSQSYFTQVFKKYIGCTPSAYQLHPDRDIEQTDTIMLSDVSCIPPETYSHKCEKYG